MYPNSDRRKGFHLLQPALQSLSKSGWQDRIELVVFGASEPKEPADMGFKSHYLGRLSDEISLALVYAAADVFVAPSVQDNLPNTVMEAIACGTPCVAFNIGGMPDMIEHHSNGYLAQPYQVEDLAQGIAWVIDNRERHQKLCDRARQKAEQEFTLEIQARRYQSLFTDILRTIL
jgi:glycosyltransferase involved in cell wall biosynthesis